MCQLVSAEGENLGAALYLPQNIGPTHLQDIVNQLLHNVRSVVQPSPPPPVRSLSTIVRPILLNFIKYGTQRFTSASTAGLE